MRLLTKPDVTGNARPQEAARVVTGSSTGGPTKLFRRRRLLAAIACLSLLVPGFSSGAIAEAPRFAAPIVYLTPKIEGAHIYPAAERAERLSALLNELEPSGPAGAVQVGYTVAVTMLDAYRRDATGRWQIDMTLLEEDLAIAAEIGRPIVIALFGNHFVVGLGSGGLPDELIADPRNLMAYQDGTPVVDTYFTSGIVGYTLSTDPAIPVNAYRRSALIAALERIHAFGQDHPDLLIGIELLGEAHHLFPDLRSGNDRFEDIRSTDYSAASRREFRRYLRDRGWTLEALNRHVGARFMAWEDVVPPGFAGSGPGAWTHWDSFAAGAFPIAGWVDHPGGVAAVTLVLDTGTEIAATRDLNRTDVYDALDDIDTPNIGFRGTIDLESLAAGWHGVTVRVDLADGQSATLGHRVFFVGTEAEMAAAAPPPTSPDAAPHMPGLRGNVDDPERVFAVRYNPFAALWHDFRQHQVLEQMRSWIALAQAQGFSGDQIYTYQLAPSLVGGWNSLLYAIDPAYFLLPGARPGVTAYGGSADTPHIFDLVGGRPYGLTEFHTLRPRHPEAALEAMWRHFEAGAVFVSPFFLSLVPQDLGQRDFEMFLIRPDNPNRGSDHMYRAILELAAH